MPAAHAETQAVDGGRVAVVQPFERLHVAAPGALDFMGLRLVQLVVVRALQDVRRQAVHAPPPLQFRLDAGRALKV